MKAVGLSGTNGSGKDTIGQMLAERHGFLFISATDMLREEARNTGREANRKVLAEISTSWRKKHGMGAVVDVALERYGEEIAKHAGVAIASLRHPGEADRIHELGGIVVWVQTDPRIGYERIQTVARSRGREAEDIKTYEQFVVEQEAEMHHSGDEATLNIADVRDKADISIENNGHDIGVFKNEAEQALTPYLTS